MASAGVRRPGSRRPAYGPFLSRASARAQLARPPATRSEVSLFRDVLSRVPCLSHSSYHYPSFSSFDFQFRCSNFAFATGSFSSSRYASSGISKLLDASRHSPPSKASFNFHRQIAKSIQPPLNYSSRIEISFRYVLAVAMIASPNMAQSHSAPSLVGTWRLVSFEARDSKGQL